MRGFAGCRHALVFVCGLVAAGCADYTRTADYSRDTATYTKQELLMDGVRVSLDIPAGYSYMTQKTDRVVFLTSETAFPARGEPSRVEVMVGVKKVIHVFRGQRADYETRGTGAVVRTYTGYIAYLGRQEATCHSGCTAIGANRWASVEVWNALGGTTMAAETALRILESVAVVPEH